MMFLQGKVSGLFFQKEKAIDTNRTCFHSMELKLTAVVWIFNRFVLNEFQSQLGFFVKNIFYVSSRSGMEKAYLRMNFDRR